MPNPLNPTLQLSSALSAASAIQEVVKASKPEGPVRLSQDTIFERLQAAPPALVKEIGDLVQRQMAYESARQQRLDAKATSLLGAVGLTLTVLSTFGVQILTSLAAKADVAPFWQVALLGGLALLATAFGILAGLWAVRVLAIRSYLGVGEEAIFSQDAIEAAKAEGESKDEQENGVAVYRRMMIEHLWPIVQQQEDHHAKKAALIARGHVFFLIFLGCVPLLGLATYLLR